MATDPRLLIRLTNPQSHCSEQGPANKRLHDFTPHSIVRRAKLENEPTMSDVEIMRILWVDHKPIVITSSPEVY